MIGLVGRKIGMTQMFDKDGRQIPVTVLEAGPCYVTDLKTEERDGYTAVQLGFDPVPERKINRAEAGHLKKGKAPSLRHLREIRTEDVEGLELGQEIAVDNFEVGDFVDVEGVSKGRGFQGVVKRHHFKGGEAAHGAKFGRESGSIGQGSAFPSRVPKGRKMAGQMGNESVTVQNLKVLKIDKDNNLLVVQGAVPGANRRFLLVRTALKKGISRKWKVPQREEKAVEKPAEEIPTPETQSENSSE